MKTSATASRTTWLANSSVKMRSAKSRAGSRTALLADARIGRHEGGVERALGEDRAEMIGQAQRDEKRVGHRAGAEDRRQHHVTEKAGDAREQRKPADGENASDHDGEPILPNGRSIAGSAMLRGDPNKPMAGTVRPSLSNKSSSEAMRCVASVATLLLIYTVKQPRHSRPGTLRRPGSPFLFSVPSKEGEERRESALGVPAGHPRPDQRGRGARLRGRRAPPQREAGGRSLALHVFRWRMTLSENRFPLFGVMRWWPPPVCILARWPPVRLIEPGHSNDTLQIMFTLCSYLQRVKTGSFAERAPHAADDAILRRLGSR